MSSKSATNADLSQQKRLEIASEESTKKISTTFHMSPIAICITTDHADSIVEVNNRYLELLGYEKQELIDCAGVQQKIFTNAEDLHNLKKQFLQTGFIRNYETSLQSKSGKTLQVACSLDSIEIKNEPCILMQFVDSAKRIKTTDSLSMQEENYGSISDIAERKLAREAIILENERLFATLGSIGDGVITTDISGSVVFLNKAAEELTGWSQDEAQGKLLETVLTMINETTRVPCDNPVKKILENSPTTELTNHLLLISRDGSEYIIAENGAPILDKNDTTIGVVIVFRDITKKQKLLDTIHHTSKLDSLGVLAAGIAHDFNNLLGGIFGYIDIAKECTKDKQVQNYLSKASGTIDRARLLTDRLLTFAKGGEPTTYVEHLFPFIQETTQAALSGSSISCDFTIDEHLWPCNYDKIQIRQVIDNIIINAQQAMPTGGTIKISSKNICFKEAEHPPLLADNYVEISFKDSGIGIPKPFLPRIFDPFYTTKSKGHGLGLSVCYSIINRHNGYIDVESEPGNGSTFKLYLPAFVEPTTIQAPKFTVEQKRNGTILIMDDEEVIREVISTMLKSFGYKTLLAENGKDAIALFSEELQMNRPISGMIFDLTIRGGLGGKETIREIRKLCTKTPVFVSSGYAEDPVMANPSAYGFTASISKPFRRLELSKLLDLHLSIVN